MPTGPISTLATSESNRCQYPEIHCTERQYENFVYCYRHAVMYNDAHRGESLAPIQKGYIPPPPKKYVYDYKWAFGDATKDKTKPEVLLPYNTHHVDIENIDQMLLWKKAEYKNFLPFRGLARFRYEKRGGVIRGPVDQLVAIIDDYGRLPKEFRDKLPVPKQFQQQLAAKVAVGAGGPWKVEGAPEKKPRKPRAKKLKVEAPEVEAIF